LFSSKRNGSPKNLLLLTIIFTFENTKKSTLKTGTPISISKSFFGKPPGFAIRYSFYTASVDCGEMRKRGTYK